ncbi:inner membrane protein YiaA [soil metagenome]
MPTSSAFVGASWSGLFIGVLGFLVGLWNATLTLSEKGFYFAVLTLGLYAAISLQKAVRDKLEGIPVTSLYYGLSWLALGSALLMMVVGLWNSTLAPSEKGFYGMAYSLSLFAAVAVQKNVRDRATEPVNASYEMVE